MWLVEIIGFVYLFLSLRGNRSRIHRLQAEVDALKTQVGTLLALLEKEKIKPPVEIAEPPPKPSQTDIPAAPIHHPEDAAAMTATPVARSSPDFQSELNALSEFYASIQFEQAFWARIPVWTGGIALVLAGFFLVKYSIEIGLLTPIVRVVIGILFGLALLYMGNWLRNQPPLANETRIAQALSGAGIADLYVCFFAATRLYGLIPEWLGFAAMAAVTATAVVLSLRHGMPIALLGLVGGFVTPALVGSANPQAPLLFMYLYLILAGLLVVIHKQSWWIMAVPTVLGAFLWVFAWVFGEHFTPNDSLWLGLFLSAVSATVVALTNQQFTDDGAEETSRPDPALNYLSLGGALSLMGLIAAQSGFAALDWGLFGLLTVGGIGLAFFDQKRYGLMPWLSMAVNAILLMAWKQAEAAEFASVLALFGGIYVVSGYWLQSRSAWPLLWAELTVAASLGYYLLAYFRLRHSPLVADIPLLWGLLALVFAALGMYALREILRNLPREHPQKQPLLTIYAATVSAFLAIGMGIELQREFLSVAIAAQVLTMAWINTRVEITSLRNMVAILVGVFAFLLIPQILLLVQLTAYSLVEAKLRLQEGIPLVDWPVFQLGLPALFFAASSGLLRKQYDGNLVYYLEIASVALVGVMGYYLTRHAFHAHENVLFVKAGFVERGAITNIIFVYGIACLWLGRYFLRQSVSSSGLVLCAIALFRISYFDLLIYNPLWAQQAVGEWPLFNALLLNYGLPIVWIRKTLRELPDWAKIEWDTYGCNGMLLLAFTLLSLNVRQLFHGTFLNGDAASHAEIYTYSIVWLLFGIGLSLYGTLRHDKMIRVASLAVMVLTVGKVFLYDASALAGLFRVFSFFGLGLCLLALSWFYARFVRE